MTSLDLEAYLDRVRWVGPLAPTPETLARLQVAHLAAIPFENLDIHLGQPIRLDLASLEAKLVRGRRGGYCFEQNSLFAAVLKALGFQVTLREARVRRGATHLLPRTHLCLQVDFPEGSFLADVGFGADGALGPVPMTGREACHSGDRLRVVTEGTRQVLEAYRRGAWQTLYALEPSEVFPVDLEMGNHYTSTHPESRFVQTLTVQLSQPEGRWILRNLELTQRVGDLERMESVPREGLLPLLEARFGLSLPAGTRFPVLDGT